MVALSNLLQPGTLWCMVLVDTAPLLAQMRRGTLQYCVLAVLRDRERYAFEIVQELAKVDGMVTSEGTIYPLLSRLRRDGLLDSNWQESASGPPRRYYGLSLAGQAALDNFITQWTAFRGAVDHFINPEGSR